MSVIEHLVQLVKPFEGLHKVKRDGLVYPYICPAGYATQGYGLRVASLDEPPITQKEAEARMLAKLPYYVEQTLRWCPRLRQESDERIAAISDFTFNLGEGKLKSSTLRRVIQAEDFDRVPSELRKWVFGGGKKLPGLILRREAEVAFWQRG